MTDSGHILLVDDEDLILEFARLILEEDGYRVTTALDGQAALAGFEAAPGDFDLLLTDMAMPKMDGLELARRCLALRPDLPVILCSGYGDLLDRGENPVPEINRYLIKPVLGTELCAAVAEAIRKPAATVP